jgi:hypothetical protein
MWGRRAIVNCELGVRGLGSWRELEGDMGVIGVMGDGMYGSDGKNGLPMLL